MADQLALVVDGYARVPAPAPSTPSWFTPLPWWLNLEQALLSDGSIPRPFDLDPCGHPSAPVSAEIAARRGFVYCGGFPGDDGLRVRWAGRVAWVNPPYAAEELDRWLPRMMAAATHEAHGLAALLPAWTDREWWHVSGFERARVAGNVRVIFIKGRLHFGWPGHPEPGEDGARFPSCVAVWRCRP